MPGRSHGAMPRRTTGNGPLPRGGGRNLEGAHPLKNADRRRTHESVRVQLVQAFLGSLLIVLISFWACVAGLDFG